MLVLSEMRLGLMPRWPGVRLQRTTRGGSADGFLAQDWLVSNHFGAKMRQCAGRGG
jgi:hypothetical protein